MKGCFSISLTAGGRIHYCVPGGNKSLGSVRTEQIKHVANELLRRFPDKFTNNFDENKHAVSRLTRGTTIKVRNQIAGYITHALAGMQTESAPDETLEEPQEEEAPKEEAEKA
jgi:small subunit ribosomal protein S17e